MEKFVLKLQSKNRERRIGAVGWRLREDPSLCPHPSASMPTTAHLTHPRLRASHTLHAQNAFSSACPCAQRCTSVCLMSQSLTFGYETTIVRHYSNPVSKSIVQKPRVASKLEV